MPLKAKINVALREQNCQKIGSERVNMPITDDSNEEKISDSVL